MSEQLAEVLIQAAITVGVDAARALFQAINAGDVSTVAELAKVLPDAHAQAALDEALIAKQRAKAGA